MAEELPEMGVRFLVVRVELDDVDGAASVEVDEGHGFNQLELEAIIGRLQDMYLDVEVEGDEE